MAFLMRNCMSLSSKRLSMCEINRLKYMFSELRPVVGENKKYLSATKSRHFATENDVKFDKPKIDPEQVYYGPLTKQVRSVKVFTILSSVAGLLAQPLIYAKVQELGLTGSVIALGTFYGFFVLVSPFLVHLVTKRYVTHVEYNEKSDSYSAYTYTFFLRRKKIQFTPDDVKVPTMAGIFTTVVIKGNPLFLDPKMFNEPGHYARIMGYDKPIDFSIESDSEEQKK